MAFDTLPETLQGMYNQNFAIFYKLSIIIFSIILCLIIIKYFKPKESKYILVKNIRTIYYFFAWIFLSTIPFHLGYLSPMIPIGTVLRWVIMFYTINFFILGGIVSVNTLYYGSAFVTDLFSNQNKLAGVKKDFSQYFGEGKRIIK